jgi:hypothetical protein
MKHNLLLFQDRPRKRPRSSGSSASGASSGNGASGGAIIESMHHHGKGVYSGTFSGKDLF